LESLIWLDQLRVVALRCIDLRAHWRRNHVSVGILFDHLERIVSGVGQPRLLVLFRQDRGHAVLDDVNLSHELVGGHGDDGARLDRDAISAGR